MASSTPSSSDASKPKALTWAYYVAIVSAALLIVSALVMITTTPPDSTDQEVIDAVRQNYRFLGIVNIIGGLIIAALAAQFSNAGFVARRVYVGAASVLIALNLMSIMLDIGGIGMMLIVVLLAVSVVVYLTPSVSTYISTGRGA